MPHLRYNKEKVGGALVPYVGPNGNWWVGKTDTGISANFSGTVYTPIKGVDYFTEEDIAELLAKADATTIMKTIISNIGNMNELSDTSAESLVEAINNYALALKQLQLQIISINNYMVDEHTTKQELHMPTYYSTEEFDINTPAPAVWNQLKSSYPLSEIPSDNINTENTIELQTAEIDLEAEDQIYAVDQDTRYVSVSNISLYNDGDDTSSIQEGELIATMNS